MALDRRDNNENRTDLRSMTLTLTVSLFIAMLAFFMILNSYASESDRKIAKIHSSIADAFGLIGEGEARDYSGNDGSGTAGDMEVATSAALRSVLPDAGFKSVNNSSGHMLSVAIPSNEFDENWEEIRMRLADLMTNTNPGGRYKLQILTMNTAQDATHLAAYAATLEEEGIDPKMLAIGYEARGHDVIELRFIKAGG
ncbi:MAG TPA: hypothetical protein VIN59_05745 [Alphaproteobacteria bacterium]